MDGQDLLDELNNLTDESIESSLALTLFNLIKNLIEGERPWRMLVKEDSSQTITTSNTYLTAKTLPSDFLFDIKVLIGDSDGNSYEEYDPVSYELRRAHKNSPRYSINYADSEFYILDTPSEQKTIYLYYIYQTDDIALDTSPVWPAKFHKIISFLAAEIYKAGVDVDEIELRGALQMSKQGALLYNSMKSWDNKLKLRSMNNSTPMKESSEPRHINRINV